MRTAAGSASSGSASWRPPAPTRRRLFESLRWIVHTRVLATDALLAATLLALSSAWLVWSRSFGWDKAFVQLVLVCPLVWRRVHPSAVFVVMSAVAVAQWVLGYRLVGDAALLVGLYTVAVHQSRARALMVSAVMEIGAVMATARWHPAGTVARSFLFLTATVVAALFAGLTVRSGSEYMGWLAERAERLEIERDQQASLGAAAERARIAREMHDIVAHSLSVVVTLADAASVVSATDPTRAAEAMQQVSAVGRQALTDMRSLIGVLRTETANAELDPAPSLDRLDDLVDRVRATGLEVTVEFSGRPFVLGDSVELTLYRIVQEALTNTLKHAGATRAAIVLRYEDPLVDLNVTDNGTRGTALPPGETSGNRGLGGNGIEGMRERASLHQGTLRAGPCDDGGWVVSATVCNIMPAS